MTPRPVLILFHTLAPYGSQRYALALCHHFPNEHWKLTVCHWWGDDALREDFERLGTEVISLKARRVLDPFALGRLVRTLHKGRYAVVHAHVPEMVVLARLALWFIPKTEKPRLLYTMHNPFAYEAPEQQRWHSLAARLCDGMTFCSTNARASFAAAHPSTPWIDAPVVHPALPPGRIAAKVDEEVKAALRHEAGWETGETLLLSTARFSGQKDLPTLLYALQLLLTKGMRLRLVLLGDGELEEELRQMASKLGVDQQTRFLGVRADAPLWLHVADIFVLSSRWEGLAISILEAMAAGLPIVATDVGGLREALEPGLNALLVPPGNPAAFAGAVASLIRNPALARVLGTHGRERQECCFASHLLAVRFQKIYQEMLSINLLAQDGIYNLQ